MFFSDSVSVARKNLPPVSSAIFFSVSSSTSTLAIDHALVAKGVRDRHRRLAADAGADGVNLDAKRLRGLRRGLGHDLAHVVLAVGEQHDDLRFARLIAQAIDARGEAEPMAVPSSTVPICTRSRFCWSQS